MTSLITRPEFYAPALLILFGTTASLFLNVYLPRRRARREPTRRDVQPPADAEDATATADEPALPPAQHPGVTFADVAGLDEALAELREVREYLTDPERFRRVGAVLPKGVLLCGPPGNGKTLLGRALAGEADVPFHYVSAASFVEELVGRGAARIRDLFKQAKKDAPSIVFIDELDAVGRRRSGGTAGGGDREFDHTLNQLLVELDGFDGSTGVLILGASNRPELLDSALVRPGRFDRRIYIDPPDRVGRAAILRLHASTRPFSRSVDWDDVASHTAGLTGAELANIVNEACMLAARRYRTKIGADDVDEAIERSLSGPRSARLIDDEQKRLIAYHEAGHALLAMMVVGIKPPPRVSVVARSGVLARSPWSLDEHNRIMTRHQLIARLIVLLGGRAAEMNTFNEPSTQAEDDLDEAARLARRMVEQWGMTGKLELAAQDDDSVKQAMTATRSDAAVRDLLVRAERTAAAILTQSSDSLTALAEALFVRETLTLQQMGEVTGEWAWRDQLPERPPAEVVPLRA